MSKQLPDDWISGKKRTLNVTTDLGFRNVPAGNLTISKYPPSKNSEVLFCRWLALEDEDTRPYKGRTNEGTGKRKYLEGTTDVTRVIKIGSNNYSKIKYSYTYLLKSMILLV